MEAKDTVFRIFPLHCQCGRKIDIVPSLEEQAEVSYRAGIKEVVEWLNSIDKVWQVGNKPIELRIYPYEEWQAKLKEWGISI